MKVKIPKVISIGSHSYQVFFDEAQEDSDYKGTASYRKHKIFLNPNLHPNQTRVTFLHEIFHIVGGVNDTHPPEQDVVRLAESFSDFLFRCLELDLDFSEIPKIDRGNGDVI